MAEMVQGELSFAASSVLMGLKIIIAYDILRVIRIFIKHNVFFENVEDFIFSNVSGLFVFGMVYFCNDGIIRGFSLFLVAFMIWLYNRYVSRFVIKWINKGYKTVRKTLQKHKKADRIKGR